MDSTPRWAVIDLGTNTFHLLIVEPDGAKGFGVLHREQRFVKLALDGIEWISAEAWQRAMEALEVFDMYIDAYGCEKVRALGTAGLRTAGNATAFLQAIREKIGIEVEVIDGQREAELIFLGTRQAIPMQPGQLYLIMDIGGGSVEFILCDHEQAFWAESFPLGVAVLRRRFHRHEPIQPEEERALRAFLDEQLAPLRRVLTQWHDSPQLIGASGTFDVLAHAFAHRRLSAHGWAIARAAIRPFARKVCGATLAQRLTMKEVPAKRADMIPVALILLEYVLDMLPGGEEVLVSAFALKEGVLAELLEAYHQKR